MKRSPWYSDLTNRPPLRLVDKSFYEERRVLISTREAAEQLGCSIRRVRAMLIQGRLLGELDGCRWVVNSPLRFYAGKRGPQSKAADAEGVVYITSEGVRR